MNKNGNILIIDDNKAVLASLELLLSLHFEKVICISTPELIADTLRQHTDLNVALLDMNFRAGINSGNEGLYWYREIKRIKPMMNVVLFTAYADIELAVNAIKNGAYDFITKPWDNRKLVDTLKKAVKYQDVIADDLETEYSQNNTTGTLEDMEISMIKRTIEAFDGNMSEVANKLGITRQTLYNKLKKYEIR